MYLLEFVKIIFDEVYVKFNMFGAIMVVRESELCTWLTCYHNTIA